MRLSFSLSFGAVLIGASLMAAPVTASAAPLAGALSKELLSHSGDNSLVIKVQRRRGGGGGGRGGGGGGGGGDAGAAIAAGAIGLAIGAIVASEAARQQQGVEYCMRRYRSYNPETGVWVDRRGGAHRCP